MKEVRQTATERTGDLHDPREAPRRRGKLALAALCYLAFVVYGSIVPLDFNPMAPAAAIDAFTALLRSGPAIDSHLDFATNVLLSIPLAFLWTGALWPGRNFALRLLVSIAVFCACVAVSVSVEFLQLFFRGRTASRDDILAQAIGEVIGITLWWLAGTRVMRWIDSLPRARSRNDLAQRFLIVYLLLMFGYNVLPLDLSISPVEIYHKWHEGRVLIVPFSWPFADRAQAVYGLASDVAIWVPVGFLWRLSSRRSSLFLWMSASALAALIELLQLFVYSRVSDTTDVLTAAAGAALGVGSARIVTRFAPERPSAPVGTRAAARSHAAPWLAALLIWLGVEAVVFWYPFNFSFEPEFVRQRLQALSHVPLEAYFYSTELRAVTEVLHKIGFMLPLGIILGGLTASFPARVAPVLVRAGSVLFICAVAAGIELVQVLLPEKVADLTDWFLEVFGGVAGYVIFVAVLERLRRPEGRPIG
jgi:glycopeptide antibiotics resistance protein